MEQPAMVETLTEREMEIARLIAEGLSNYEIAAHLVLTHGTVKWYCVQIYSKLGVNTRPQAIKRLDTLKLLEKSDISPPVLPKANVPIPLSTLIGREREIEDIQHLLHSNRLLTLTGPGGTGKTRMALEVAIRATEEFADGVSFVDLAPIVDATQVARAIAQGLGIMESRHEALMDKLEWALADQEHLLLLDNFEQVMTAAPVVGQLLMIAPCLKILVTSREPLQLSGEQEYAVPTLTLPVLEDISVQNIKQSQAVVLFEQRTRMIRPDFEITHENILAIAEICIRLDGLPLAIELAAKCSKLLSPQAMLARLKTRLNTLSSGSRDVPHRHQTLHNTLEWSYNLLNEGERVLFARLAVFRGGRSLEAIEAICGECLPIDVFDGLVSLVDKSLILQKEAEAGEPRFIMLETIHEYARERLEMSGERASIHRRHTEYFTQWVEHAQSGLYSRDQYRWYQRLDNEHENINAAFEWSLGEGDVTMGIRMASCLESLWDGLGYYSEGYRWTQLLLQRLHETPLEYHPKFLFVAVPIAHFYGDEMFYNLLVKALEISKKLDNKHNIAQSLLLLAQIESLDQALPKAEESLRLFRELKDEVFIRFSLRVVAETAQRTGDPELAQQAYDETLFLSRQAGDMVHTTIILQHLSRMAQNEGDHYRALALLREALTLSSSLKLAWFILSTIALITISLAATGEAERAVRLGSVAEHRARRMGIIGSDNQAQRQATEIMTAVRAQLDEVTFQAMWAEGHKMTLEEAVVDVLGQVI